MTVPAGQSSVSVSTPITELILKDSLSATFEMRETLVVQADSRLLFLSRALEGPRDARVSQMVDRSLEKVFKTVR